jgi:hypothetical protein
MDAIALLTLPAPDLTEAFLMGLVFGGIVFGAAWFVIGWLWGREKLAVEYQGKCREMTDTLWGFGPKAKVAGDLHQRNVTHPRAVSVTEQGAR